MSFYTFALIMGLINFIAGFAFGWLLCNKISGIL